MIFENNHENTATKLFQNISIFVDADVSYINFGIENEMNRYVTSILFFYKNDDKQNWKMFSVKWFEVYDIYNNAFELGGRLRVNKYLNVFIDNNETISIENIINGPKTVHRKYFDDVTLHVGAVVSRLAMNRLNILMTTFLIYLVIKL